VGFLWYSVGPSKGPEEQLISLAERSGQSPFLFPYPVMFGNRILYIWTKLADITHFDPEEGRDTAPTCTRTDIVMLTSSDADA
jgi:hypothetical protein